MIAMNIIFVLSTFALTSFFASSNAGPVVVQAFQGTGGTFQPCGRTSVQHGRISVHPPQHHRQRQQQLSLYDATTGMSSSMTTELEQFLQQEHSMFYALLLYKNEYVWKMIRENSMINGACTIFAPTNVAMQALGEKKLQQLQDNRNEEVRNKIGSYHFILDDDTVVTTEQLYNSGGIRTIATGDNPIVPVERTKRSGGNIFTMFTNNNNDNDGDGTVTLGSNNARIVNSIYLQNSNTLIHQIDTLISPNILWRYCDQLRIPGSK